MIDATRMTAISKRCNVGLVRLSFGVGVCVGVCMPFPLTTCLCWSPTSGSRRRGRCARIEVAELRGFVYELHGYRGGGLCALAAVFNDDGVDDLRIIGRRKADEPGIGQALGFVMF